jgi:hypothetical protein
MRGDPIMMFKRGSTDPKVAEEQGALYVAADEARWLAEERGISGYWEVARVLEEALPDELADTMEYCWAHAGVLAQQVEGDDGHLRRLLCHAATLRERHPDIYEAIMGTAERTIEARACPAA